MLFSDFYEQWENRMKKTTIVGVMIAVYLAITSLFPVPVAAASTTENECISGGGYVSEGAGCKFCVGGKFDLSEIRDTGKNGTTHEGSDQKSGDKTSGQSGAKTPAKNKL
jgi:hypothetical protein